MERNNFIKQYQLSDALPTNPFLRSIPAEGFATAVEEFINDRFLGIARVELSDVSAQSVLICAEYYAYFMKILLTFVYGRAFLTFNISSDKDNLIIEITSDREIPLTSSERASVIKAARNSGMEIYPDSNRITLVAPFKSSSYHKVYAISVFDGKRQMLAKLTEIFYCGSPITLSKPRAYDK